MELVCVGLLSILSFIIVYQAIKFKGISRKLGATLLALMVLDHGLFRLEYISFGISIIVILVLLLVAIISEYFPFMNK
jgi:Na+/H+ antiporter NhaD/arsenite permease-like protein